MLEMSLDAAAYLDDMRRRFELPETAGLRIWAESEDPGAAVHIGFTRRPRPADEVVEQGGSRVFVAPEVTSVLLGQVLDLNDGAEPPRLYLRDQDATDVA